MAAGEPAARRLVALAADAGVTIAPYPKQDLNPGETFALGTLRTCEKRYGADVLTAALKLLRAADGTAGLSAAAIMGTADALHHNAAWAREPERLGPTLTVRGGGIAAVNERVRARRAARGGTEWANFAAIVTERLAFAARNSGVDLRRLMAGR